MPTNHSISLIYTLISGVITVINYLMLKRFLKYSRAAVTPETLKSNILFVKVNVLLHRTIKLSKNTIISVIVDVEGFGKSQIVTKHSLEEVEKNITEYIYRKYGLIPEKLLVKIAKFN